MITVAIVETTVYGVLAYHWECRECGATGTRQDRQARAVAGGERHLTTHEPQ